MLQIWDDKKKKEKEKYIGIEIDSLDDLNINQVDEDGDTLELIAFFQKQENGKYSLVLEMINHQDIFNVDSSGYIEIIRS